MAIPSPQSSTERIADWLVPEKDELIDKSKVNVLLISWIRGRFSTSIWYVVEGVEIRVVSASTAVPRDKENNAEHNHERYFVIFFERKRIKAVLNNSVYLVFFIDIYLFFCIRKSRKKRDWKSLRVVNIFFWEKEFSEETSTKKTLTKKSEFLLQIPLLQ